MINEQVKCIFKYQPISVEGKVISSSDDELILETKISTIIINSPKENLLAIEIFKKSQLKEIVEDLPKKIKDLNLDVERSLDPVIRTKSLVELKKLKSEQEKNMIINKLKNHTANQNIMVEYEYPIKKQSPK